MPKAVFTYAAPALVAVLSAPSALAQLEEVPSERGERVEPVEPGTFTVEGMLEFLVRIANVFIAVVAVISLIMIVWGGFKFATSGGDPEKAGSARGTILYGVIGLAVALLAFAIIAFVNSLVNLQF